MQDSLGVSLGQVGRVEDGDRMEVEGEVEIGAREAGGQVARKARIGELALGVEGIARGKDAREEERVVEKDSRGKEGVKDSEKWARCKEYREYREGVDMSGLQRGSGRGNRGGHQGQGRGGPGGRGGNVHGGRGFGGSLEELGPR